MLCLQKPTLLKPLEMLRNRSRRDENNHWVPSAYLVLTVSETKVGLDYTDYRLIKKI